ncbi:MAG: UDP-N-acetylenolpyruvoylglucosamine reductase MurB, partial [Planctomycetota bacterium]
MSTLITVKETLWSDLDVEATLDAPIGPLTWYETGGRAEALISPKSVKALQLLCQRCDESGIPLRVLGSGANLLVADEGVDGVVIRLNQPAFQETLWNDLDNGNPTRIGAGVDLMGFVQESARRGLSGLSQLAGIPATIGGAVRMNAGGSYGDTAQSIHSIELMTMSGRLCTLTAADLDFGYRHCALPAGIVIAAHCNLRSTDPVALRAHVKEVFEYKKRTQPMGDRSAGCMFKNPIDPSTGKRESAGKLIDLAGIK